MIIFGICGSLRKESWNKLLLQILLNKLSQNNNISTQEIDISDFPLYNADIESIAIPESVVAAKEKISSRRKESSDIQHSPFLNIFVSNW